MKSNTATRSHSSKYFAGWKTAETDHKRGMSPEGMRRVPRENDDPDWRRGYIDRAEQLIAIDEMFEG